MPTEDLVARYQNARRDRSLAVIEGFHALKHAIRFGAASAHGKANMVRFNFFEEQGAFVRNPETGTYRIDKDRMTQAMTELSRLLLTLQGDGDYAGASELIAGRGVIGQQLQADLDRLTRAGIPVDITFRQGKAQLGLE